MPTIDSGVIEALAKAYHGAPFDVLGLHALQDGDTITGHAVRTIQPQAAAVFIKRGSQETLMERIHPDGVFEVVFPDTESFVYQLKIQLGDGKTYISEDPYRFSPILTEFDLHLFNEGTHYRLYNKMGARIIQHEGVMGVAFDVWAPAALRVSVVGTFNGWDGRRHPMRLRDASGIWELFIPGVKPGDLYKYEISTRFMGYTAVKADPYGYASELRPSNASKVWDISYYPWTDGEWMAKRKDHQKLDAPISIYEVHLGSWKRKGEKNDWLTYRELADELVPYLKDMGFTHMELLPITEYPYDGSWGYQVTGYYAPTARFGTPDDFRYFIDKAHEAGLGVILDWVPAHFPKDAHGLGFFDGTHLYEHADPRQGEHRDWGTFIYNLGRNEVVAFLLSNVIFWLEQYHIDGLRVDAVASMLYLDYSRKPGEWIPNRYGGRENLESVEFLKRFNNLVHEEFPDVLTFAEESTAWPMVSRPAHLGGLGFDLKWNMGWMHDILEYMQKDPIYRRYHHHSLTFSMVYAFTENFTLPFSHDEVVHGKRSMLSKMPGDKWRQFANARALYAYMYAHPGKKLLFMGQELGQWIEWNFQQGLDWMLLEFEQHKQFHQYFKDLNNLYKAQPALYEVDFHWEGFQWIDFHDVDNSTVSFIRKAKDPTEFIVIAANFTPVPLTLYRVGVPTEGYYRELLNSDAAAYGGSNMGNSGGVQSEPTPWQGFPHSILITIPPLGVVYFKPDKPAPALPPAPEEPAAA